jgi:hypothetical protein
MIFQAELVFRYSNLVSTSDKTLNFKNNKYIITILDKLEKVGISIEL